MRRLNKLAAVCVALAMVLATGLMVSCSSDSNDTPTVIAQVAKPYLPPEDEGKTVEALYTANYGSTIIAVYIFSDKSWVATLSSGLRDNKGTWERTSGTGFTDCTVKIVKTHKWNSKTNNWEEKLSPSTSYLTIANGQFTLDGVVYTKQ